MASMAKKKRTTKKAAPKKAKKAPKAAAASADEPLKSPTGRKRRTRNLPSGAKTVRGKVSKRKELPPITRDSIPPLHYDYDSLLDGKVRCISKDEIDGREFVSVLSAIRQEARFRSIPLVSRVVDQGSNGEQALYVQAVR